MFKRHSPPELYRNDERTNAGIVKITQSGELATTIEKNREEPQLFVVFPLSAYLLLVKTGIKRNSPDLFLQAAYQHGAM